MEGWAIVSVWSTVLFAPPLAVMLFVLIRKSKPRAQLPITVAAIFVLLFIFVMKFFHFSFTSPLVWLATFVVAYFTYSYLVAACLQIPFKIIRYLSITIAVLPICLGYVAGTIGILGLMWIVGDYFRPPERVQKMGPGLICEVTGWGAVGSTSGYDVRLYQLWPAIPFIEREVAGFRVDAAAHASEDKTCSDAMAAYSR